MPKTPPDLHLDVSMPDRGEMANRLFDACRRLGFAQTTIRSTSGGFWVPREIAVDLFPSDYTEE